MRAKSILLFAFCLPLFAAAQQWDLFSSLETNYTVSYPEDWTTKANETGSVVFKSPSESENEAFRENVIMFYNTKNKLPDETTINDVTVTSIESLKNALTEFNLEKNSSLKINDTEGVEITYTGYNAKAPELKLRVTQRYFIYNHYFLLMTYTALANERKWDSIAEQIMNSFKFE